LYYEYIAYVICCDFGRNAHHIDICFDILIKYNLKLFYILLNMKYTHYKNTDTHTHTFTQTSILWYIVVSI